MTEGMKAFAKRYKVSLDDPNLRRMYDYEMSARRDQASREYNAEMKGLRKGREEERLKTRNEQMKSIRSMMSDGLSMDAIYKYAGAPKEEVDAIIAEIRTGN